MTTEPTYPQITVRLSGTDGNVFAVIGRVADALRTGHDEGAGFAAPNAFSDAAFNSGSHDDVLRLAMRTVNIE